MEIQMSIRLKWEQFDDDFVVIVLSAIVVAGQLVALGGLIPYQLKGLYLPGGLLSLAGLLLLVKYRRGAKGGRNILKLTIVGCLVYAVFLTLQSSLVISVYYGNGRFRFLVGTMLTEQGIYWMRQFPQGISPSELIYQIGYVYIPVIYGNSYLVVATTYSIIYLMMMFVAAPTFYGFSMVVRVTASQLLEKSKPRLAGVRFIY